METTPSKPPPPSEKAWFSLPFSISNSPTGTRIEIAWRQLLFQVLGAALVGWLFAAVGGYCWIRFGQDFPGVRFLDVALPNRWPELRRAWGDHFIDLARAELKQQKWVEGVHHLRYGVARSPGNTEGRMLLAQIFLASRKPEMAEQTMLAGYPHASNDVPYLRSLFSLLLQTQADDEVLKLSAKHLPAQPTGSPQEQLLVLTTAMVRYYRGDYDAAEDLVERFELWKTKEGRILQVWLEWERGYRDLALHRLANLIRDFPREDDYYREMIRYQRQLGQPAQVQRYGLLRQSANPQNPEAHIDLMYAFQQTRNQTRLDSEVNSYLGEFGQNGRALLYLAELAANSGDSKLAQRVLETARKNSSTAPEHSALMLMWIEAHVVAGEHREAIARIEEFGREQPDWFQGRAGVYAGLRAIAHFGLQQADLGELHLKNFLGQKNLRADNLVAVSNRLMAIRRHDAARRVLSSAIALDSRNQAALAKLVELDLDSGQPEQLSANLPRLLAMRRPSSELLSRVASELGSDRYLFLSGREGLLDSVRRMRNPPAAGSAKAN